MRAQRLFDKPYGASARHLKWVGGSPVESRGLWAASAVARRAPARPAAASVLLLALPLLLTVNPTIPVPHDSAAYNSGAIQVRFASDAPSVQLVQDANPSVNSVLSIAHVLELAPLNGTHPLVILAADPANSSAFNVSQSGGVGRFDLGLNGNVGVRYAGLPLWSGANLTAIAANPTRGVAELALSYSLLPAATGVQGVAFNWSIRDWPWQSTGDLLGLELQFAVPNSTGFNSCLGRASPGSCSTGPLAPGGIVWTNSSTGSVGAAGPGGSEASISWNSTALASNRSVGVTAGTFYSTAGVDRVTLASPGRGSEWVNGSARFLLTLPLPSLPRTLSGNPYIYLGSVLGVSVLAAGAVQWARRRDRRIAAEL